MKKFLAILLAALLLISTLVLTTGCSSSNDKDDDKKTEEKADKETKAADDETEADADDTADDETEADADDTADEKDDKDKETEKNPDPDPDPDPEEVTIVGKWETELDLTDLMMESMMGADEGMASYFDVDEFIMVLALEFEDDGTYALSVDADSFEDSFNKLLDAVKDGMPAYMVDMYGVDSVEELDEMLVEEMGMTLDELIDEAFSEEAIGEEMDEMLADMSQEGTYEYDGGDEIVFGDGEANSVELTADTLKLDSMGEEIPEEFADLLPFEFEKVA